MKRWVISFLALAAVSTADAGVFVTLTNHGTMSGLACIRRGDEVDILLAGGARVSVPASSIEQLTIGESRADLCDQAAYVCQDRAMLLRVQQTEQELTAGRNGGQTRSQ